MHHPPRRRADPRRARRVASAAAWLILSLPPTGSVRAGELPEPPAIAPDVLATIGNQPVHGHVSPRRSTHDGRVRITGNGAEPHRLHTTQVELFAEELAGEPGFSNGELLKIDPATFHASTAPGHEAAHVTLCDPYLAEGTQKNPYACAHGSKAADCYDVTVVQVVHFTPAGSDRRSSEIWSTPVTLTVTRPKTANANVAKLELRGPSVKSPIAKTPPRSGDILIEPITSGDGRLLVVNSGSNLLYSVMGAADTPCDARGWRRLDHISRMHSDGAMSGYEIARYPIRDSENKRVKAGRPVRGAYPWIDREARNLFFTQVSGTGLYYDDGSKKLKSRFEVANPLRRRRYQEGGPTRFGMSYFGLWTQGKVVIPDTRVNSVDFQLGRPDYEPRIELYSEGAPVRVGEGTITKINSPENEWNYRRALKPRSPHDVVWWVSANNAMTGEVVFDDALDLGALIFSPMNASIHNKKRKWRDGFDYGKKLRGYVKKARLQNAAASELLWEVPSHGKLFGARIEPIAAGGVVGKGLWLDGAEGRIEYTVPQQPAGPMAEAIWSTSLWVDPRDLAERRRLLSFPDGSWVDVVESGLVLGGSAGESSVAFPGSHALRTGSWSHLAFVSGTGGVDVYLQGFKLTSLSGTYLRVAPGTLTVGRPVGAGLPGFRGWIDELRVASGPRSPETVCNWADGTLRGLDPISDSSDFSAAGSFPASSHEAISHQLTLNDRPTWERYLCERDRSRQPACLDDIHRTLGGDPKCARAALLFPEGPIFHDRPRPDSTANLFCQNCHARGHPTPSLRIGAPLQAGEGATLLAEDDRRQPSQAPRRLHGFVPKALLGLGQDLEAPPEGMLLDPLLYPAAPESN